MKFTELSIGDDLKKGLEAMGFDEMTEIQERAIPRLVEGVDLIGKSQTGTGKTMAFAIPAIQKIDHSIKKPQILVLLPTRELALQVAEEFKKALRFVQKVKVTAIFGGAPMHTQLQELKAGAQIVVGTPGRVMDHMRRKSLKLADLSMIVLDEADEMLNMGFREDIETILEGVDHPVQTVLFSATMPAPIMRIAKTYQTDPEKIEIEAKSLVATTIEQKYFNIDEHNKFEALTRLLDVYKPKRSLIFCNTKHFVDTLTENLTTAGYAADKIHGDMRQSARHAVLKRFSTGRLNILVATDVAARGIDVDNVDIVFNYDVPDNEEYYVHRIGRTGRAGKSGLSLTLARSRDQFKLKQITNYTKKSIEKDLIPTGDILNDIKISHFTERFKDRAGDGNLERYLAIVQDLMDKGHEPEVIAAVLLKAQLPLSDASDINQDFNKRRGREEGRRGGRSDRGERGRRGERGGERKAKRSFGPQKTKRLFIDVGVKDHVQKRDILGAICGESGIPSSDVGSIDMYKKFTFVDIEESVAKKVEKALNGKYIKDKRVKADLSTKRK